MTGTHFFESGVKTEEDIFLDSGVKTEEDTLSKEVAEKNIWTRFWVEFVGRVGTQPGKTLTTEDTEFGWVRNFME